MKKSERHNLILEAVQNSSPKQLLSTKNLAEQFDVSETTIRRDFQELANAGLIQRQYGGAHPIKQSSTAQLGQVGILLASRFDKYRDPFFNIVLEGADKKLGELGYHVAYIKTFYDVQTTQQAKELLDTFDVDGLILLGTTRDESINYLRKHFSPIVTITDMRGVEDDAVLFDGVKGMTLMVEHLAKLGYRRPGYISGSVDIRYQGFIDAINAHNMENTNSLHRILTTVPAGWTPEMGEQGTQVLMSQEMKPDVIVCASDRIAIGAIQWLRRHGYHVSDDIAVTGFDNIPDSEFTFPPLTTINVHKMLLGEIAAERIIRRIENPDEVYLKIIVPTSLVIRQSCGSKV
jgi:DNA-binding LacI/PurR family transcriptional regulator